MKHSASRKVLITFQRPGSLLDRALLLEPGVPYATHGPLLQPSVGLERWHVVHVPNIGLQCVVCVCPLTPAHASPEINREMLASASKTAV